MVTPPASQFCTPSSCSTTFREKRQPFKSLDTISIQPGIHRFYPAISFTQKKGFSRFNLAAYCPRKYRGQQEDEPWYLLTNLTDLKSAGFTANVTASKQCLKTVKPEDII
jgi:hypothetical protein